MLSPLRRSRYMSGVLGLGDVGACTGGRATVVDVLIDQHNVTGVLKTDHRLVRSPE
jgi:hypothetical protein